MRLLLFLTLASIFYPSIVLASKKVLLSSVQTLTLYAEKFSTGSRSSPIAQLRCIDGKSPCRNLPSAVQCYNMGSDGIDVQWKCEAQLPQNVQFDSLQVQCEGYEYPDDPYVLTGSCGLTYSLKPAGPSGSSSHREHRHRHHHQPSSSSSKHEKSSDTSVAYGFSPLVVVVVLLAACYAIYTFCLAPASGQQDDERPFPDAPPPPYSESDAGFGAGRSPQYGFRPEFTAGAGTRGSDSKYRGYQHQQQQQQQDQQSEAESSAAADSGPGFWTGAALGGLAGYLFGNSSGAASSTSAPHASGGYYGDDGGYRGSSGFNRTPSWSSSSTTSSCGGEPVTRTGYGTTRRR